MLALEKSFSQAKLKTMQLNWLRGDHGQVRLLRAQFVHLATV